MAIGYVAKHNRLPLKSLLFYSVDTVLAEEGVEVGAVDVDFASDLREWDEALVSVVLPCFWRNSEDFTGCFGFYPFAAGVIEVATKKTAITILQDSINSYNITSIWVFPFKMPVNVIISKRLKFTVGTFCAFIFLLIAIFPVPFPATYRLIAALAC